MGWEYPHVKAVHEHKTVIDLGGSLTWIICIILSLAIIHFSCGSGTATGYLGEVCSRGIGVWDYLGIICCAPLYLLFLVLSSGGLRIW
jgi:hypothetical protein